MSFEQEIRSTETYSGFTIKKIFVEWWHEDDQVAVCRAYVEDGANTVEEIFLLAFKNVSLELEFWKITNPTLNYKPL